MKKVLPKIIEEISFDFNWSEDKIWTLDVPVEKISIQELEWHFEIPFWNTKTGYYDLKPKEVINFPENHKEEYQRTMETDLSYPIDIMENKDRWLILDGLHRLVKTKVLGKTKVEVRKISHTEIINIIK